GRAGRGDAPPRPADRWGIGPAAQRTARRVAGAEPEPVRRTRRRESVVRAGTGRSAAAREAHRGQAAGGAVIDIDDTEPGAAVTLPTAIADRLGFLSATTGEVLRAAALLGTEFSVIDLAIALGRPLPALTDAL